MTAEELFWTKVEPEPNSGCWLWMGYTNRDGYGTFSRRLAHRFAYELYRGPIPAGLTLDHLCRMRSCVNAAHLEICSQRANVLRGNGLAAQNARKAYCPNGHPYATHGFVQTGSSKGRQYRRCRLCWRKPYRLSTRAGRHRAEEVARGN